MHTLQGVLPLYFLLFPEPVILQSQNRVQIQLILFATTHSCVSFMLNFQNSGNNIKKNLLEVNVTSLKLNFNLTRQS